jgi:hypothetical protein
MLARIITVAGLLLVIADAPAADSSRQFVGTWRWRDVYTDSVAQCDLTLKPNGDFALTTSYPRHDERPFTYTGWWRSERGALALNFWCENASEEHVCPSDFAMKIIEARYDKLFVIRSSEKLTLQRVK